MAETSTLQRTSNIRLEEELSSLLEGKDRLHNTEYVGWRNPTSHALLDSLGSQSVSYPTPRRNVSWSHLRADELPLAVSIAPETISSVSTLWYQIPNARGLIDRRPVGGSDYWRPRWFRSHDPIFQVGGVTWDALITSEPIGDELAEALLDLNGAMEEAEEQGYPEPSRVALINARHLLRKLYRIAPRRFEVYPTPDAEIAIDVPGDGMSLVVLCDAAGGALCMANLPDGHRTKFYPNTDILPDGFVSEALAKLLPDSN